MNFCMQCGCKNEDGARFCSECGADIAVPSEAIPNSSVIPAAPAVTKKHRKFTGLSVLLSFVIFIFVSVFIVVSIAGGTVFNIISSVNFGTLLFANEEFEEITVAAVESVNRNNDFNIDIADVVDILNDDKLMNDLQNVANGFIEAYLTGDARNIVTEREIREIIRTHKYLIEYITGIRLDNDEIDDISSQIRKSVLDAIGIDPEATDREIQRHFDRMNISGIGPITYRIISPMFGYVLIGIIIAAALIMLVLNFRHISFGFCMLGVPLLIGGLISFAFVISTSAIAKALSNEFSITLKAANELLGSYLKAGLLTALPLIIAGVLCIVFAIVLRPKQKQIQR